jgi:hypothetical protein
LSQALCEDSGVMKDGGHPEESGPHGCVVLNCVCEQVWLSEKGNCVDKLDRPWLNVCVSIFTEPRKIVA